MVDQICAISQLSGEISGGWPGIAGLRQILLTSMAGVRKQHV
jgi:hypothetical protein